MEAIGAAQRIEQLLAEKMENKNYCSYRWESKNSEANAEHSGAKNKTTTGTSHYYKAIALNVPWIMQAINLAPLNIVPWNHSVYVLNRKN